jgi:prepilin-type N-terminal cleavage/methylation domain-containing protein
MKTPTSSHHRTSRNGARPAAFTLIEVLVSLLLIGIVIPAIMHVITISGTAARVAKNRNEATELAKSQLALILAGTQWQTNNTMAGDFSPDWPQYSWKLVVQPWTQDTSGEGIDQLDLTVIWTDAGGQKTIDLTTLAYPRAQLSS